MQLIRRFLALWAPAEGIQAMPDAEAPMLERLVARWTCEGVAPHPPEDAARVQQVFRTLGFEATPDVLALYGAIGGMNVPDDVLWRLWPLDEVVAQPPSAQGVLFSDYLISCWEYRLLPVSAAHSAVYVDSHDGQPPRQVAPSLDAFFARYIAEGEDLMNC